MESAVRQRLAVGLHELRCLGEKLEQIRARLLTVRPSGHGIEEPECSNHIRDECVHRALRDAPRKIIELREQRLLDPSAPNQLAEPVLQAERSELRDREIECRMAIGRVREVRECLPRDLNRARCKPPFRLQSHAEALGPEHFGIARKHRIGRTQDRDVATLEPARLPGPPVDDGLPLVVEQRPDPLAHRGRPHCMLVFLRFCGERHQLERHRLRGPPLGR